MPIKYTPNRFAKQLFNLAAADYTGDNLQHVMLGCLGKENYVEYMLAVDPLWGGKKEASINIIINRDEIKDPGRMELARIGKVEEVEAMPAPEPRDIGLLKPLQFVPKAGA